LRKVEKIQETIEVQAAANKFCFELNELTAHRKRYITTDI